MLNIKRVTLSMIPEDKEYLDKVASEKHLTVSYLLTQILDQLRTTGICDLDLIETNTRKRKTRTNF